MPAPDALLRASGDAVRGQPVIAFPDGLHHVALVAVELDGYILRDIADGGSRDFGSVTIGSNAPLTFTIRNTGDADLTGLTISKNGANPGDFTVTLSPSAPVSGPSGTTSP